MVLPLLHWLAKCQHVLLVCAAVHSRTTGGGEAGNCTGGGWRCCSRKQQPLLALLTRRRCRAELAPDAERCHRAVAAQVQRALHLDFLLI